MNTSVNRLLAALIVVSFFVLVYALYTLAAASPVAFAVLISFVVLAIVAYTSYVSLRGIL